MSSHSGSPITMTRMLTRRSKPRFTAHSHPVRTGGRSSKSGAPWPGTYSPALNEELGRIGRETHFDPLAMCLLDDLENRSLVEVGLREDHLVGPHLIEHERELCA